MGPPADVTRLLADCREGREGAFEALLAVVYDELRQLAQARLRRERAGHTLQPTALVHEAFMKLVDQEQRDWANRRHFLALAATAMRRILINYANQHGAAKRGGGMARVTLFEAVSAFEERAEDLLSLDGALERLVEFDPQGSRVVELRFFAGLSAEDTARVLGVSTRTVERSWRAAKAWLRKEIAAGA